MNDAQPVVTNLYSHFGHIPVQIPAEDRARILAQYEAMTFKERFGCPDDQKLIPTIIGNMCHHWTAIKQYYGLK